jgi:hypothetical protein
VARNGAGPEDVDFDWMIKREELIKASVAAAKRQSEANKDLIIENSTERMGGSHENPRNRRKSSGKLSQNRKSSIPSLG